MLAKFRCCCLCRSLNWVEDQRIELIDLGADVGKLSPWKPVSEEVIVEGLRVLLNSHKCGA